MLDQGVQFENITLNDLNNFILQKHLQNPKPYEYNCLLEQIEHIALLPHWTLPKIELTKNSKFGNDAQSVYMSHHCEAL
jgi:hypothetical protein